MPLKRLKDPSRKSIEEFKKKRADRRDAAKARDAKKEGAAVPGGAAVDSTEFSDWRNSLVEISTDGIAMAFDDHDVDLSDLALVGVDDAGGDTEDEDDDNTPQYWYVLVPVDGSQPQLVCMTSEEQLAKDHDMSKFTPIAFITFPTEDLYEHGLMHILVYLGRSKNLGCTRRLHLLGTCTSSQQAAGLC